MHEHAAQPLLDAQCLQQPLLLRHRQLDVARHEIGKLPGIGDRIEHLMHDFLGKAPALPQLRRPFADFLVQRLERGVLHVECRHLLDVHHDGGKIPLDLSVLKRGGALLTLEQKLHAAEATLHLADASDDAH